MPDKNSFGDLFASADKVLKASQSVDYRAVVKHHRVAVRQLNEALKLAGMEIEGLFPGRGKDFRSSELAFDGSPTTSDAAAASGQSSSDANNRRDELLELVGSAGYGARVDMVYYAQSDTPTKAFSSVAHRSGLPAFEVVLAPDYTPKNGVHAVFITANSVYTAALCYPEKDHQWQVLINKPFDEDYEMLELLTEMIVLPEGLDDVY